MTNNQVRSLIELLEAAHRRPGMYLGALDPAQAESFILGINIVCSLFDDELREASREASNTQRSVIAERGWKWPVRGSSVGLVAYLRDQGLSEANIVTELFAIELERWKRVVQAREDGEDAA